MKFEIGNYYQHTSGDVIWILSSINTFFHGAGLLAEQDDGRLMPVGQDETSATNWRQVSGWPRSCYESNGIPEPTAEAARPLSE